MTTFQQGNAHTGPSFPLRNRIARAVWNLCWLLLFRPSPKPFHAWRAMLLKLWGAKLGGNCHIYPSAQIWAPWNLVCEEEVGVGERAVLYNQAPIFLGRRSVISQGTHLCTGTHDYTSPGFELHARPIHIGALAWVAAEAFVHPGVTIGEGAVVAARSVVVRSLPPWMVCAGNPCVPLKSRVMKGAALDQ